MFNSIPAPGGGSSGPAVDETARAAAAAAQDAAISAAVIMPLFGARQLYMPHRVNAGSALYPDAFIDCAPDRIHLVPIYIPPGSGPIARVLVGINDPAYWAGEPGYGFRVGVYSTGPNGRPSQRLWQSDYLPIVANDFSIAEIEMTPLDLSGFAWVAVVGDLPAMQVGQLTSLSSGEANIAVERSFDYYAARCSALLVGRDWYFNSGAEVWEPDVTVDTPTAALPATLDGTWPDDAPGHDPDLEPFDPLQDGLRINPMFVMLGS